MLAATADLETRPFYQGFASNLLTCNSGVRRLFLTNKHKVRNRDFCCAMTAHTTRGIFFFFRLDRYVFFLSSGFRSARCSCQAALLRPLAKVSIFKCGALGALYWSPPHLSPSYWSSPHPLACKRGLRSMTMAVSRLIVRSPSLTPRGSFPRASPPIFTPICRQSSSDVMIALHPAAAAGHRL